MRRILSLLVVVCLAAIFLSGFSTAENRRVARIDETQTRFLMQKNLAEVLFVLADAPDDETAVIKIELVAPNDDKKFSFEETAVLDAGKNEIRVGLPNLPADENLLFYRLRYEIKIGAQIFQNVVAVSQIVAEIFEIEIAASERIRENQRYVVRARAVNPLNRQGVEAVKMAGEIEVDFQDDREPQFIRAETLTDDDGFAILAFDLPAAQKIEDIDFKIVGSKSGLQREINEDLNFSEARFAYLQTDKPLYQPGQMLRVRTLFFNEARRAVPNADLIFAVKDPEKKILQKVAVKTSRFGVASFEWQIGDTAKLGDYQITVQNADDASFGQTSFKVSRYDLPNFVVNAKADKQFYLPADTAASVEIRADYLFGKPVSKAKIRVVEENNRKWNYEKQIYETDEGAAQTGELDADGKFTVRFDLTKKHGEFYESDYQKFKDLRFAAYVTDVTTNRTEQRRFDVRLTKQEIHVRLINESDLSKRLPPKMYVSTFYADGTPAKDCAVKISSTKSDNYQQVADKTLAATKSNKFGAGMFFLPLENKQENNYRNIVVEVVDNKGKRGSLVQQLYFRDKPAVQIQTNKTIYKPGEAVKVEIRSSEPDKMMFVDVARNGEVVRAEQVSMKNGRGEIKLPYREDFKNALTIAVYGKDDAQKNDYESVFVDSKTVLFPHKNGVNIAAETKQTYHPGEEATINLTANRADGNAGEIALGVVVLDKAITERARTDADFGVNYSGFYSDFYGLMGLNQSFGSVTRAALDKLNPKTKIPDDLHLAAEIMLQSEYRPRILQSGELQNEFSGVFYSSLSKELKGVGETLDKRFRFHGETAANEADLIRILRGGFVSQFDLRNAEQTKERIDSIDFTALRDPWGNAFRPEISVNQNYRSLAIKSTGADESFGTGDDITAYQQNYHYFQPFGEKLNRIVTDYHQKTGGFVHSLPLLRELAKAENFDIDKLRDAFGKPFQFQFGVGNTNFIVSIKSGGANGKIGESPNSWESDDFFIWQNSLEYFGKIRTDLTSAITKVVDESKTFPASETEFAATLKQLGFDLNETLDAFGKPYFVSRLDHERYSSNIKIIRFGGKIDGKAHAVKNSNVTYAVRSAGADGVRGSADDFEVASFTGIVNGIEPNSVDYKTLTANADGTMNGTVTDQTGAVVTGAKVRAVHLWAHPQKVFETTTNENGFFSLPNLPAGQYEIKFESPGFMTTLARNVYVQTATVTNFEVNLEIGAVTETVSVVRAQETTVDVTASQISDLPVNGRQFASLLQVASGRRNESAPGGFQIDGASGAENDFIIDGQEVTNFRTGIIGKNKLPNKNALSREEIETPRLREYFPETLVWQPEIITDANGKAELKFKLADSLTTWKMAIIGSTEDGEIGVIEQEFQAFQPFFAEHEPPKILTEGDNIALPVTLRNYLDTPQTVAATMTENSWFKLNSPATQNVSVAPNDSSSAIFNFEAVASIQNGKQKVTAIGTDSSDAIEKPVSVHPNGREIAKTQSRIFTDKIVFDADFPAETLPNTARASVKVYPNLMAHVVESVEGILKRPYGCGEQTISSTYPSVLILKSAKNGETSALKTQAEKFLQIGYDRLIGYKAAGGGFTYWGTGEADFALSAYGLKFLTDAKQFVAVDENVIRETRDFLIGKQNASGDWNKNALTTAYIAKILARVERDERADAALKKALIYLAKETEINAEPYFLANFALAAFDAGDAKTANAIAAKLQKAAKTEGDKVFWETNTATPFYGWGTTGKIETTALVLQVLAKTANKNDDLTAPGLLYLLTSKDRYGVWHSTQTTINVLDALLSLVPKNSSDAANQIQISVNNQTARTFEITAANDLGSPIMLDVSQFLSGANDNIEISQSGGFNAASAQIVQTFYVPWTNKIEINEDLNLKVNYDKPNAAIMEEITCRVEAQKKGANRYGMLLAEIGLPPGADVSRESLQNAMANDWTFSRYDILPDKIIVYLWAKPNGNNFEFKFKLRYGINAVTAPSGIYDYYNPESNAVVAPTKFAAR